VWSNIKYVTLTGEGDDLLIGDVNGDGEVNIGDVTAIINYILTNSGGSYINMDQADINHDGEVNVSDVTSLINLIILM
jgi:hypothetical protein